MMWLRYSHEGTVHRGQSPRGTVRGLSFADCPLNTRYLTNRVSSCAAILLVLGSSALPATRLRYDSFLVFEASQDETIRAVVHSLPKAKFVYKDEARVIVLDSASRWIEDTQVALGERRVISYRAPTTGLHAICVQSGSNVVHVWVEGRPWAVVARQEAPLHISGTCDAWHFAPPAGLDSFSVFVHANVKGEAAIIKIAEPDGNVALEQEGDFDTATALKIRVPAGTDGRAWRIDVLDPGKPGFALDDVTIWLGRELQPLLCLKPEWLEAFKGVMGYPPEKITQRVLINDGSLSLRKNTPRTVRFSLEQIPSARLVALRAHATDVDYGREAPLTLNGVQLFLPVTGDGVTADVTVAVPRTALRTGKNVVHLAQDPVGGSGVYSVDRLELLFGEAINFE